MPDSVCNCESFSITFWNPGRGNRLAPASGEPSGSGRGSTSGFVMKRIASKQAVGIAPAAAGRATLAATSPGGAA